MPATRATARIAGDAASSLALGAVVGADLLHMHTETTCATVKGN